MGAVAAGHATDLWGVGLVTLGVLCAVAFYGGSLGPIGRGARVGMGDLLGWGRFLLPPVLIAVGVRMMMGRGDDLEGEQTSDRRRASSGHAAERVRREPARAVIGGTLVLLSVSGMAALTPYVLRLAGGAICLICSLHGTMAVAEGRRFVPYLGAAVGGLALAFGAPYILTAYGVL